MKKKLALLVLAGASLAAFAGTCVFRNDATTDVNGDAVYGSELRNETGVDFLGHKFVVAFLNDDLVVIETQTVDGCLRSLQADASDFFSVDSNEDFDDVEVVLRRVATDSTLKLGETVDGELTYDNIEAIRDGNELVVTGNVENTSGDDLEDVRVCAVVYNNTDDVSVVERDDTTFDLDDGDDANFSITLEVGDDEDDSDFVDIWGDAINIDDGDDVTSPESDLGTQVEDCDAPTATPTQGNAGTQTAIAGTVVAGQTSVAGTATALAALTPPPTATATPNNNNC